MIAKIGNKLKFQVDFINSGICIQQGKVVKVKRGLFTEKYLIELKSFLDFNTVRALWIKEKDILEIIE